MQRKHLIMKKIIFALSFILAPNAVFAQQLLPDFYAQKFCHYSQFVTKNQARELAIEDAMIIEGTPEQVIVDGKSYRSDVVKAVAAAKQLCPQYFN